MEMMWAEETVWLVIDWENSAVYSPSDSCFGLFFLGLYIMDSPCTLSIYL